MRSSPDIRRSAVENLPLVAEVVRLRPGKPISDEIGYGELSSAARLNSRTCLGLSTFGLAALAIALSTTGCASPLTSAASKADQVSPAASSQAKSKSEASRLASRPAKASSSRRMVTDFVAKPFRKTSKRKKKSLSGATTIPMAADVGLQRRGD